MRYIINVGVPVESDAVRRLLQMASALTVTKEGAYTSLTKFLCGENPWGYHQDLRFAGRPSQVRQGLRIMRAAEKAEETSSPIIELSDDDYAVLSKVVEAPERGVFGKEAPPVVARLMLAFVEAIEGATTERPNMEQIVEASHE